MGNEVRSILKWILSITIVSAWIFSTPVFPTNLELAQSITISEANHPVSGQAVSYSEKEIIHLKKKIRTIIILNTLLLIVLIFIITIFLIKRKMQKRKISNELKSAYEQMEKMAVYDPLTQLYNKRSMTERIEIEMVRMGRTWKPFCIVMIDIDSFNKYNKMYGHECGDKILESISIVIKNNIRCQDAASRWGGEEFLVLLPETSAQGGYVLAEKIRKAVEESTMKYGENEIKLTVTCGITAYSKPGPVNDCIRAADMALYRGKNRGKNISLISD